MGHPVTIIIILYIYIYISNDDRKGNIRVKRTEDFTAPTWAIRVQLHACVAENKRYSEKVTS